MLETQLHQASGLSTLARTHSARLVVLVSHGDHETELALLSRLCNVWVNLGYPVTVLDSNASESESELGLEQQLEHNYKHSGATQNASAWMVLPAARGLKRLSQQPPPGGICAHFANLFGDDGIVIVYGPANALTHLLADKPAQPLMVVSSSPESLLTSYLTLKQLLATGHLTPLIVTTEPTTPTREVSPGKTLIDCARNFLGRELKCIQLNPSHDDDAPTSILQRTALRILENAPPLGDRWAHMPPGGAKMTSRQLFRSH